MPTDVVFVSGTLPGDAVEVLSESFTVVQGEGLASEVFAGCAAHVRGIVALLTDRIDATLLARAPRLAVVANVAVGVDNVDLDACRARGVVVTNTPDVLTEATADFTFGLLLATARRIAEGDRLVRRGAFTGWTPTFMLGTRVFGMKLGIVGLGRIGRAVARRARGFGMHVGYTQRTRLPEMLERAVGATYVESLDELCATSDAVSLHCPLSPETHHLFDARRLALLRPTAILVNTARGPIVDEAALAEALAARTIGGAGLDVFEDEPRVNAALLHLDNVVLAPHIASADVETRRAMASLAGANVARVLRGEPALTPV
jgi:glyoxylate reductase